MRKYAVATSGDGIVATIDGVGKPFNKMVNKLKDLGCSINEVSEEEYFAEKKRLENEQLDEKEK